MKRLAWIFGILFLLICGVGSYMATGLKKADVKTDDVATVTKGDVEVDVVDTGTIEAAKIVQVKSQVSGRLAHLYVDEGDHVTQGQLIAVIDPRETRLLVEQGRAQLAGAQSAVEKNAIQIQQRRQTALSEYQQAQERLQQMQAESDAQPALTREAIVQAETALNQAIKERDRLVHSAHPIQRASALSTQQQAQANFDAAQSEYARQQALLAKQFASQHDVETAKQNVEVAKAQLASANESLQGLDAELEAELAKANEQIRQDQAALDQARTNAIQDHVKREDYLSQLQQVQQARAALADVPIMEKDRDQAQATVDQLSSSLADSERQLGETEIRAPITGIVSKKLMQEGELVASLSSFSAGTAIIYLEDRSSLVVTMDVNEIDTALMAVGMPATITIDALPNLKLQGKVKKIAPTSLAADGGGQDAVVKYEVQVTVLNADPRIRTGMTAKVNMTVAQRKGVLTLPAEYIIKDGDKRYVELPSVVPLKPDEKPQRKEITIGLENGSVTEILSGLALGDKVHRPAFNGPSRQGFISGPSN